MRPSPDGLQLGRGACNSIPRAVSTASDAPVARGRRLAAPGAPGTGTLRARGRRHESWIRGRPTRSARRTTGAPADRRTATTSTRRRGVLTVGVRDGVSAFAFSLRALIAARSGGGGGTGGGGGLAGQGPIFGTLPSVYHIWISSVGQAVQNGSVGERLAAPGVARRLAVACVPHGPGGAAGGVANVGPPTRPADDSTATTTATPTPASTTIGSI